MKVNVLGRKIRALRKSKKITLEEMGDVFGVADERKKVNEYLAGNYPHFHRFVLIFFHSGARLSELMRLKKEDIELGNQRYRLEIRKGKEQREVFKTIKTIALPLWTELFELAKAGEFIFSTNQLPGKRKIHPSRMTRLWCDLVKKPLGISADLYSLKHLNTGEMVDQLGTADAARHNSHTNEAMVIGIYDTKKGEREHQRIKEVNNPFA